MLQKKIGFGAILHKRWIRGNWLVNFLEQEDPSIEFLELFALCAGVLTWQNQPVLRNAQIVVHCDNIAVIHMINNLTSSCGHCMYLLRLLVLEGLWFNRKLRAVYINTKRNVLSNALSRNQMKRFFSSAPEMHKKPDVINPELWPVWKVWSNLTCN